MKIYINLIGYYFDSEKNIEYLLTNIIFYPYEESNFGIQGLTFHNELKIILSGLPISNIKNEYDYTIYKILETARKIIIILHEVSYFIKRALNLLSNGDIINTTIDSLDDNQEVNESGLLLESLLFWEDNNYKFLNLNKALIILNPLSYEKEFTNFKENFNREKTVTKKEMADELIEYLKKIGLETSDYNNKKKDYNKYVIDCSKKYEKTYHIVYHSENHNLK